MMWQERRLYIVLALAVGLYDRYQNLMNWFMYIIVFFVCLIWVFTSHRQSFSYVGTGLPGLNQY